MGLTEYWKKRDFRVTSEPKGGRVKSHKRLDFVIQKHDASHLHYDFRLELDGVLKSWAVPKGPSLDPAIKRLAMHVEDHPLEYGDFEGIIPRGEYGGGTVLLWDQGTWEPVDNGKEGYRDGSLKFVLNGEKLRGHWMLVRRGGRRGDPKEKHWFLFKERDEFARPDSDIAADEPRSVTTGRDLEEIAEQADRVWGPKGEVSKNGRAKGKTAATPSVSTRKTKRIRVARPNTNGHVADLKVSSPKSHSKPLTAKDRSEIAKSLAKIGTKRASIGTPTVQLAQLAKQAPEGDNWIHEIKFDGYRMLCRIADGKARFISRNGKDWTKKFPALSAAAIKLPITSGLLDGEVVVLEPDGTTSFQALQNAFQSTKPVPFWFYVFDLLFLNGMDIKRAPLENRKALLQRILPNDASFAIKYSDHVTGNGPEFFAESSRLGLEGIISKRLGRAYVGGRGPDWLKVKCSLREEFVIGGFTKPSGSRKHFGALLLGYYDKHHKLIYAGRVGTGFDVRTLASLYAKLLQLVQKQSAFKNLSGGTGLARGVTWLKPSLVAQIQFSNWTDDGQLRHPAFLGLREDKVAKDVVREQPVSPKIIESSEHAAVIPKAKRPRRSTASSIKDDQTQSNIAGVNLSHPDKLLYPDDDITKCDLARYYELVASWVLPHVENRLLSLVRCPAGSGQKCFFQKHPGEGTPDVLRRFDVTEKNKMEEYLALYDLPGLISLIQMGVLEIHTWGSQADQFEKPDRLIFDLDPDPVVDWPHVVTAAKEVRLLLEELDLNSFIKTTGGKGLHVVVPIRRRLGWEGAKNFCKAVADFMVAAAPDRYIAKMSKAARKGKIFVDYLRNDRGATAIAPYSTRNRAGAPVSVPIGWEELGPKITSDHFNIRNLPARLARLKKDPWADIGSSKQAINASMLRQLKAR